MNTAERTRAELEAVIGDSLTTVEALQKTLNDERHALAERDTDALDAAIGSKQQQITTLARLESRRIETLDAAGFGGDADGMRACADWCGAGDALVDRWHAFCAVARDLSERNLANGAAIRLRQQQVQDNLALLRGTERSTESYGPTGNATASGGRSLTEA